MVSEGEPEPVRGVSPYPPIGPPAPGGARPFWSVMIPLCDPDPAHLRAGLGALLLQEPDRADMEIVLVDDASSDIAWLDPWLADLELGDCLRLVRQEHRVGIGGNWNDCVRHARGEWVHILHQDDLVRPGFHDRLRSLIGDCPDAGAAFCRDTVIDDTGRTVGSQRLIRPTPGIVDDWIEHVFVGLHLRASALVVRRAVYEALGGFRLDLDYALDWDMWKRIAAAWPLAYWPEALVSYRRHAASASNGFQRSGANLVEIARSIALSEALLPSQSAAATTRRTRENYARYGANLAWTALADGDLRTAGAQLRGARRLGSTRVVARALLQQAQRAWRVARTPPR